MGMMNEGLSIADAMAIANGRDYDNGSFGYGAGGTWIWVFFLFFLLAWGGNGFFGNGGANSPAFQGALTRGDLCESFNFNDLQRQVQGVQQGLCDGFYAMNTTLMNGFHGVDNGLCQGFNSLGNQIQQARFDSQQCCCETNRNIDAVRYENAKNTCDIVNAIREDGNATRALINANTMQDLRDKLADRDRELMTANFQLSQQAQTANIVDQIRPCAIPAYITCSPYESSLIGSRAYGYNYGCGCGCN